MIMTSIRRGAVLVVAAMTCLAQAAAAQDLSRYRGVAFGTSIASVTAALGARADTVKVIHRRPALIQELTWRPQYALSRPAGPIEAAQDITFRFHDDQLFRITVRYEARLVEGLTHQDVIEAVSAVYGPATLTAAASQTSPLQLVPGTIHGSTALARWQSADHEFTLLREVYPATYRLIGVAKQLASMATAAETEAARLDVLDAPRREAERAVAEAERRRAADEKIRTTNKGEFRP
jgi:hypothetical protein